jgi:carbamate kinase
MQRQLQKVTSSELEAHYKAGHFPPGNMGPKVESALRFLKAGGKEVVITSYEYLTEAVAGRMGTHIVPDVTVAVNKTSEKEIPVGG